MRQKLAVPVLVFILLFTSGCAQREIQCASNNDCPAGLFCVNERCSSLLCSNEGKACSKKSDCCGSLECVNGICESIPGLERTARVLVLEKGLANAYGVSLKVNSATPEFGPNCEISGGLANIELNYKKESVAVEIPLGGTASAGGALAKFESITGNVTSGKACSAALPRALIGISRESSFEGSLSLWAKTEIPGTGASATLLSVSPADVSVFNWTELTVSEGQEIFGEQLVLFSIEGEIDNADCSAKNALVILKSKDGGSEYRIKEGEVSYARGKIVMVDSISFFTSDCKLRESPLAKVKLDRFPPCRYPREAVLNLTYGGTVFLASIKSGSVASAGPFSIIMDKREPYGGCIGPSPQFSIISNRTDALRLVTGVFAIALEDVLVKLDRLDVVSLGEQCTVVDATAYVYIKPAKTTDFESISIRKGSQTRFGDLLFTLDEITGDFKPISGPCSLSNPALLFSVSSPEGSGGIFSTSPPAGSSLFIEREVLREERPLDGVCPGKEGDSIGYSFSAEKREFLSIPQKPSSNPAASYGVIKKTTGNSRSESSMLYTGGMPFAQGDFRIMGANKEGDASTSYKGMPLVIASGGAYSTSKETTEQFENCTLFVKTTETIRNYGFVKAPG